MPSLGLALLRLLPQHLLSRLAGRAAGLRLPKAVRQPVLRTFGRCFGVDFSEVPGELDSYASVQEFFTRPLTAGARPIDPDPKAVVAPCDGAWGAAGQIEAGTLLQVKGRPYSLAGLVGGALEAAAFEGGPYATFYLAPRNYHRFHAPCAAAVTQAVYLPGALLPVNRVGVEGVGGLFAGNERLCAFMEAGHHARLCLVAVGATLVGKVRVNFDDLTTNAGERAPRRRHYEPAVPLAKGEEWGRFEFGSTIVMIASAGWLELDVRPPGTELRLGTRIGVRSLA